MSDMRLVVVTPEATVIDRPVKFVVLPLSDGEKGVGSSHAPLIGRLGAGELRLKTDKGSVLRYYVESGFVEVNGNVVSVMASKVTAAKALKVDEIRTAMNEAATQVAHSDEAIEARVKAVERSRAQLRIAERATK